MARFTRYYDSFRTYGLLTELEDEWALTVTENMVLESTAARIRTGAQALSMMGGSGTTSGPSILRTQDLGERCALGFSMYAGEGPTSVTFRSFLSLQTAGASIKVEVGLTNNDEIRIRRGTTTVATSLDPISMDVKYYCEVAYYSHATSGYVVVYLDGEEFVRFDGDTVGASGSVGRYLLRAGNNRSSLGSLPDRRWTFDDFYCAELTGTETPEESILNEPAFVLRPPTSDIATDGTPSAGSDNYAMMDDIPSDGDTTHVEFAATGDKDLYGFDFTGLPAGMVIEAVRTVSAQRRPEGGDKQVRHILDNGSTEYQGADHEVGSADNYRARSTTWARNPNGDVEWTSAALETYRAGLEARPA